MPRHDVLPYRIDRILPAVTQLSVCVAEFALMRPMRSPPSQAQVPWLVEHQQHQTRLSHFTSHSPPRLIMAPSSALSGPDGKPLPLGDSNSDKINQKGNSNHQHRAVDEQASRQPPKYQFVWAPSTLNQGNKRTINPPPPPAWTAFGPPCPSGFPPADDDSDSSDTTGDESDPDTDSGNDLDDTSEDDESEDDGGKVRPPPNPAVAPYPWSGNSAINQKNFINPPKPQPPPPQCPPGRLRLGPRFRPSGPRTRTIVRHPVIPSPSRHSTTV